MAFDVDHFAVVQEPVENGRGNDSIVEQCLPVPKAFVSGNDGGAFLVAIGDELEKEIALMGVYREVADFIDNHQV